jgi:hypothetical protein
MSKAKKDCVYCGKLLSSANLSTHIRRMHPTKAISHKCHFCGNFFSERIGLQKHIKICQEGKKYDCNQNAISRKDIFYNYHKSNEDMVKEGWKMDTFNDLRVHGLNLENANIATAFSNDNFNIILNSIMNKIKNCNVVKFIVTYKCEFLVHSENVEESLKLRHFDIDSEGFTVNNHEELKGKLENALENIDAKIQEVLKSSSNFILKKIHSVVVHLTSFSKNMGNHNTNFMMNAGSYIKISHLMPSKKGILNIQNQDNKCLVWCILAHFIKVPWKQHAYRVSHYEQYEKLVRLPHDADLENLSEGMLHKIERLNNIKINIITLKDDINILLKTGIKKQIHQARKSSKNIDLLSNDMDDYIEEEDDDFIILQARDDVEEDGNEDELVDEMANSLLGINEGVETSLIDPRYARDLFYPYRVSKYKIDPHPDKGITFHGTNYCLPFGATIDVHDREINLLLVKEDSKAHLILINDSYTFFGRQLLCNNCFVFKCDKRCSNLMDQHKELCLKNETCKIILPNKEKNEHLLRFKNIKNCHKADAYIVADFECCVKPLTEEEKHDTSRVHQHAIQIPNSYALYYKTHENIENYFSLEHNSDPKELTSTLINQLKFYAVKAFNSALKVSEHQFDWGKIDEYHLMKYNAIEKCEICMNEFIDEDEYKNKNQLDNLEEADKLYVNQRIKVLHHDHHTGEYIATVCASCNHKMKDRKLLPVIFHNGRGFDWHLFIKIIAKDDQMYTKILPQSTEKFISFSCFMKIKTGKMTNKKVWNKESNCYVKDLDENGQPIKVPKYELMELRFIDSMQFFNNASLSTLIESLKMKTSTEFKSYDQLKKDFSHTYKRFKVLYPELRDEYFFQLLQKGIYPYHYVTSTSKLLEKGLPGIEYFHTELSTRDKSLNELREEFWKYFYWNYIMPVKDLKHFNIFDYYYSFEDNNDLLSDADIKNRLFDHSDDASLNEIKQRVLDYTEEYHLEFGKLKNTEEMKIKYCNFLAQIDYKFAWKIYHQYCTNFKDYHDLYLTWDVTLLCDVFENFRQDIWDTFGLESLYYYGVPGIAFDSMLKMNLQDRHTKGLRDIETLTDLDMILMCEEAQRGGISHASHRYACQSHDPVTGENSYIMYWDATNLYGWAMCQELPAYDYEWISQNDIQKLNNYMLLQNYQIWDDLDPHRGYILEVDLEIDPIYHDWFNDYPLAPETRQVKLEELSEYQRQFKVSTQTPKLLCTLNKKTKYICYIDNLKYYVQSGYKVTKVYRGFSFVKEAWLKPYVELMTEQRKNAVSEYVKMIKKLCVNSNYGRLNMNMRKHFQFEMVTSAEDARKVINKINYDGNYIIYDDDLIGIKMNQINIQFKNPISCAIVILELSKLLMQKFVYDKCKPYFDKKKEWCGLDQKFKVIYTDTDSIVANVRFQGDVYKDFILQNSEAFDLSVYSDNHSIFDGMGKDERDRIRKKNKGIVGIMKDEMGDDEIIEWAALKSKSYAYKTKSKKESFRCKGVTKTLYFDQFLEVLMSQDNKMIEVTERKMRSKQHDVYVADYTKRALSKYDDKRYLIDGKTSTLALGHYTTKT